MTNSTSQRSVKEVVDWCWANRRGLAFVDWNRNKRPFTYVEVAEQVVDAFKAERVYVTEKDGMITGVVLVKPGAKELHVVQILTTTKEALKTLLKLASDFYPSLTLTGTKRGRKVTYQF